MVSIPFPPGMTTVRINGTFAQAGFSDVNDDGDSRAGYVRVWAERKFGYAGSPWFMDQLSKQFRTKDGSFSVRLPHSNQFGLIGDNGAPITNVGWMISFQPDQSRVATTRKYILLPTSLGEGPINFPEIADLGGWPNATIVTGPTSPTDPNPAEQTQLVELKPGVWGKAA